MRRRAPVGPPRPPPVCPQFLACPPAIAAKLPTDLQRLVGYTMPGTSFGYFAEYQHPEEALATAALPLHQQRPINWASRHLPELRDAKL